MIDGGSAEKEEEGEVPSLHSLKQDVRKVKECLDIGIIIECIEFININTEHPQKLV